MICSGGEALFANVAFIHVFSPFKCNIRIAPRIPNYLMYEQGHFIQHIIFVKCFCSDFSCWFVDLLIFTGSCCSCGSGAGDGLIGNLLTPVRWLCLIRGGPLISAIWGIQMCWSCVPKTTLKNQSCKNQVVTFLCSNTIL